MRRTRSPSRSDGTLARLRGRVPPIRIRVAPPRSSASQARLSTVTRWARPVQKRESVPRPDKDRGLALKTVKSEGVKIARPGAAMRPKRDLEPQRGKVHAPARSGSVAPQKG